MDRVSPGIFKYETTDIRYQKCPVCLGRGLLPHNFYTLATVSSSTIDVQCKSCNGAGIIDMTKEI